MSAIFSQLEFGRPLILLLVILLPLLWLWPRGLSPSAIFWRSAVLLFLILALADPVEIGDAPEAAAERIFAFDLSRSIPEDMRIWMTQQGLAPRVSDRVFVFGGAAEEA